jgi:hypothetical protein
LCQEKVLQLGYAGGHDDNLITKKDPCNFSCHPDYTYLRQSKGTPAKRLPLLPPIANSPITIIAIARNFFFPHRIKSVLILSVPPVLTIGHIPGAHHWHTFPPVLAAKYQVLNGISWIFLSFSQKENANIQQRESCSVPT